MSHCTETFVCRGINWKAQLVQHNCISVWPTEKSKPILLSGSFPMPSTDKVRHAFGLELNWTPRIELQIGSGGLECFFCIWRPGEARYYEQDGKLIAARKIYGDILAKKTMYDEAWHTWTSASGYGDGNQEMNEEDEAKLQVLFPATKATFLAAISHKGFRVNRQASTWALKKHLPEPLLELAGVDLDEE